LLKIPAGNWTDVQLDQQYTIHGYRKDGDHVRLWVRATDVMNNTAVDYTDVRIDNTYPRAANGRVEMNVVNGSYSYSTRYTCSHV